ncbi:MAG TPA: DUF1643 domain-containing protein [Prolixibacteraceae bacterium]|nr:DUF1643 domain-containing protein [Prolixibacteraceae bacterium]
MNSLNQFELFPTDEDILADRRSGALFGEGRKYRYVLWRIWDANKPKVMFIGLNPSTANEDQDDPTIRRVVSFAKRWGYGGVYMLNLFTCVTAYPEELKKCENPLMLADWHLQQYAKECERIIFAWGSFPEATERAQQVLAMFDKGEALILNKDGSPRHPLYVPGSVIPVRVK